MRAISAQTLAGLMAGCRAPASEPYVPRTLTADQFQLVRAIAEHIIPETDTPGAAAARVDAFVDMMLTDFFTDAARHHFLAQLDTVDARSRAVVGNGFRESEPEDQVRVLEVLDAEAYRADAAREDGAPFMQTMKELTVSGYYTSEVGQTEELRIMPFGEYRADVPFDEIGRTWA